MCEFLIIFVLSSIFVFILQDKISTDEYIILKIRSICHITVFLYSCFTGVKTAGFFGQTHAAELIIYVSSDILANVPWEL